MRTLGIDLASSDKKTGVCQLRWSGGRVTVDHLEVAADDDTLVDLASRSDAVGIDAPFGWPSSFTGFVTGQVSAGQWTTQLRDELRFRRTDMRVRERTGGWPLSVSSDRIALAAMRCALLLARLEVMDRSGDGRVFETYPAAALNVWGLTSRGYKGRKGAQKRSALVAELARAAPWLDLSEAHRLRCAENDDALDALVGALLARAAARGLTERPPDEHLADARREGWIHIPVGGLDELHS
ncbi:MAG: DUF429 domain-containing protein [Spirochaetota bacterium]